MEGESDLLQENFRAFSPDIATQPDVSAKALVVFLHGFSDHVNRFLEFFSVLASQGIEVHGFDQRGWGRSVHSKAERGLTGPTSTVMVSEGTHSFTLASGRGLSSVNNQSSECFSPYARVDMYDGCG